MIRLTVVFAIWVASTAHALNGAKDNQEAELHEAYASAWNGSDAELRRLLDRAQQAWYVYRAATCDILGDECAALMAQERAAELRHIERLTDTNDRTILRAHGGGDDQR